MDHGCHSYYDQMSSLSNTVIDFQAITYYNTYNNSIPMLDKRRVCVRMNYATLRDPDHARSIVIPRNHRCQCL